MALDLRRGRQNHMIGTERAATREARSAHAIRWGIRLLFAVAVVCTPTLAPAQAVGDRSDAGLDADDARIQALLGTLDLATAEPFDNLFSTAPGAEQQVARPQIRFNVLAPLNFDSNAEAASSGGTQTWGAFPVANLSAAAPVGELPFRVSLTANSEFKRFFSASEVDVDRLTFSGRLQ